jgi:hypothetical protein
VCLSFFDVPLRRQEEIWVSTIGLAADRPGWWEHRRDGYAKHVREQYQEMDTTDLTVHLYELGDAHGDDPAWADVIHSVTTELAARTTTAGNQ